MNILIIEDERPIAEDLSKTIMSVEPNAKIVGVIPSVEEGIEYLQHPQQIDLIFSDIQLGDGLAFEIFSQIAGTVPIIFCTAFNQYASQAFDTMGIDYIIKPFSTASVAKAIQKFKTLRTPQQIPDYDYLLNHIATHFQPSTVPSVIVYQGERIIPFSGNDIAFFYIDEGSVFAHTFQNHKLKVNQKMDILEKKFAPFFYRTNRQFLVNRKTIKSASQYFHRKLVLVLNLEFSEKIIVGKEKANDFLEWLSRS